MKRLSTGQAIFAVGISWLLVAIVIQCPAFAVRNLKIGAPLTSLFAPNTSGKAGIYESEKLAGRPTAIVFWRPNHKFSLEVLRDIQSIAQNIEPSKFAILVVDTERSTRKDLETALAGEKVSVPILLDPDRMLYAKVGVVVSPTTLLFDAKGKLRFIVAGHPQLFPQIVETRLRFLLGDIDEEAMAEQIKPTIIEMKSDWISAWRTYNLGKQLQMEGARDEAASVYKRAIAQYPAITEAHCALGFLELEAGNLKTAARHFDNAIALDADSSAARLGGAIVLARANKTEAAEQILLSLAGEQSRPVFVRVRYELGRIYRSRGEFEKAARYYDAALAKVFAEGEFDPARVPVVRSGVSGDSPGLKDRQSIR